MGIYMSVYAVGRDDSEQLRSDPMRLEAFCEAQSRANKSLCLDKAWAAIVWLFERMADRPKGTVDWLWPMNGGEVLEHAWLARLHSPETVEQARVLLESVSDERFRRMLKPDALTRSRVYPSIIWQRDGRYAQDYVMGYLAKLRVKVGDVASAGRGLLVIGGHDRRPMHRPAPTGLMTDILQTQAWTESEGEWRW